LVAVCFNPRGRRWGGRRICKPVVPGRAFCGFRRKHRWARRCGGASAGRSRTFGDVGPRPARTATNVPCLRSIRPGGRVLERAAERIGRGSFFRGVLAWLLPGRLPPAALACPIGRVDILEFQTWEPDFAVLNGARPVLIGRRSGTRQGRFQAGSSCSRSCKCGPHGLFRAVSACRPIRLSRQLVGRVARYVSDSTRDCRRGEAAELAESGPGATPFWQTARGVWDRGPWTISRQTHVLKRPCPRPRWDPGQSSTRRPRCHAGAVRIAIARPPTLLDGARRLLMSARHRHTATRGGSPFAQLGGRAAVRRG